MKVFKKIAPISVLALAIAGAQFVQAQVTFGSLLVDATQLLNMVVPILVTVILIFMAWSGVKFVRAGEGSDKNDARAGLINGAIALLVIFSIFGIIRIVQNTVFGPGGAGANNPTGQGLQVPKVII